jgi:outer membrane immunogenic protein
MAANQKPSKRRAGDFMLNSKTHIAAIVGALSLAAISSAAAQDYSRSAYGRPSIWTGFYGGANLGYGWGEMKAPGGTDAVKPGGIVGGLHGGYNYQMQQFVVGAEADFDFSNMSKSIGDGTSSVTARFNSFSSVRGRVGVAIDRTLVFGTLGYGWSQMSFKGNDAGTPINIARTFGGLVYGGGVEYKFTNNMSLRGEVLRYNTFGNLDFGGDTVRINTPVTQFRMGVSYHF